MWRTLACLTALALLSLPRAAVADEPAASPSGPPPPEKSDSDEMPPPSPPPPPGFDSKPPLEPGDLARKKERGYFTGLPLANFDPNTGFGGGLRGYYFFNGDRKDPLFAYTPYLHRIFLQVFFTTGGLQFHWLDYDAPAIFGTPFRIRSQLIFVRNISQHYYSIGERALDDLTFSGAGRQYRSFSTYTRDLRQVQADNTVLTRYNEFDLRKPLWIVSIERTFLDGVLRPLVGLGFSYADIHDYTGDTVRGDTPMGEIDDAVQRTTLLNEECATGEIVGCNGGWDNTLRLGLSFDTRDFEPDPNSGIYADIALDIGTKALGSEFNYARFLASIRYYLSPFPKLADFVVATRGTFLAQSQGAPFFSMDVLPFTEDPRAGLGGHRTMRGFQQDRFVGHLATLFNFELRWTFYRFAALSQKFSLSTVAFLDLGRVYNELENFSFQDWKRGQGGALRIAWNQATIVTIDYGISREDSGLYINFNHIF